MCVCVAGWQASMVSGWKIRFAGVNFSLVQASAPLIRRCAPPVRYGLANVRRTQPLLTLKLEERLVFPHACKRSETRLGRDLFVFLRIAQPSAAPWPSLSPARIVHWRALCFEPPKLTGAPIGLAFVFGWKERSGDPKAAAHLLEIHVPWM